MVVDTSVLLAIVFNESLGPWCVRQLQENAADLRMSTVNYAEVLILIEDRQPALSSQLREQVGNLPVRWIPPTPKQAEIAASARLRYPLNLGDCFAYALAKDLDCELLTLDRDFRNTDIDVLLPPKH